MARTHNNKLIGAAAHAQRMDDLRSIEFQNTAARKAAEKLECDREWKIMTACERVFGDLFVSWYDSPAVPARSFARDRIALIRAWARTQVQTARAVTPQTEEDMDIIRELVKVSEYADAETDLPSPVVISGGEVLELSSTRNPDESIPF